MKLKDFPAISKALMLLGADNFSVWNTCRLNLDIARFEPVLRSAEFGIIEAELSALNDDELELMVAGDADDAEPITARCPNADKFINEAFDGMWSELIFPLPNLE